MPSLVGFRLVRDRDHVKFMRNEERPERFSLTLDHVARSKIAQRTDRTTEIVELCARIDRDERESLDGFEEESVLLPAHGNHDSLHRHVLRQQKHRASDERHPQTDPLGPHARILYEPNLGLSRARVRRKPKDSQGDPDR